MRGRGPGQGGAGSGDGVFANSGQICFAGTRVLVQRSVVDEFTERLLTFMDTLRVGNSLDSAVTLGPVVSQPQLDKVLSYIDVGRDEGAELLRGGGRLGVSSRTDTSCSRASSAV